MVIPANKIGVRLITNPRPSDAIDKNRFMSFLKDIDDFIFSLLRHNDDDTMTPKEYEMCDRTRLMVNTFIEHCTGSTVQNDFHDLYSETMDAARDFIYWIENQQSIPYRWELNRSATHYMLLIEVAKRSTDINSQGSSNVRL